MGNRAVSIVLPLYFPFSSNRTRCRGEFFYHLANTSTKKRPFLFANSEIMTNFAPFSKTAFPFMKRFNSAIYAKSKRNNILQ